MINQITKTTLFAAARSARPYTARSIYGARCFSACQPRQKLTDNLKEKADKVNHKVGDAAVNFIDAAETAANKTKKTADKVAGTVKEEAPQFESKAEEAKQKARGYAADAKETATDASEKAKQTAADTSEMAKDTADGAKSQFDQDVHKVKENQSGYESLQDKGKKIEVEQNRPDDGV